MAATVCLGEAGVDGEVRHTAADRRRSRERATVDLDPGKRGAGEGKRERGQEHVSLAFFDLQGHGMASRFDEDAGVELGRYSDELQGRR